MGVKKQAFLNAQRDVKQHYKMYKAGKNWLVAGISIATFGSALFFGANVTKAATTAPDTDSTDTTASTSAASELTAQSVALKISPAASQSTQNASAVTTSNNSVESTSATSASSNNATATASAALSAQSTTSTASTASQTNSLATSAENSGIGATNLANQSATSLTTNVAAISADASETQASDDSTTTVTAINDASTASSESTVQTTATTNVDSVAAQLPAGTSTTTLADGTTEFVLPVGADITAAKQTIAAANLRTAVTVTAKDAAVADLTTVDTGTLAGKNPTDYDVDGHYIGDSATSTLTAETVKDNFSTTGAATINENTVTLINGSGQNGSYVFDNQVDTTKKFTIQGVFSSSSKDSGGGYGIILQPSNPNDAGVNDTTGTLDGSSTYAKGQADVGIEGLPNTTFIGRDFYQGQGKNDTAWNFLTIRQTDANGKMVKPNADASTDVGSGQTDAIVLGEYYTVTWTPNADQSTTSSGYVAGTISFATYSDAAMTKSVQTLTTSNVVVSKAVSLAAFAASGGKSATDTATVTSFSGSRVTMPVTVHYVDQSGKEIAAADMITANVGTTFAVGKTTTAATDTATYAAKAVTGYEYAAVTAPVDVVNTNITSTAKNELTVTYLKVTGTQTVKFTKVPTGATGDFAAKTQTATEASTTAATAAAAHGYSEVEIPQILGYTSMISKNGGAMKAATTIAAEAAGVTDATYVVTYLAQGKVAINYQDYFGNTIRTSGSFSGNVGDIWNPTAGPAAITGYTFSAKDSLNAPATQITFSQDGNGNTIAKDANGNILTAVTLYYKTNVTVTVSATKVYDGLDNDGPTLATGDDADDEATDYLNLTFKDQNGKVLNLNGVATAYPTGQFFYGSPNVGTYPDGVFSLSQRALNIFAIANPGYNFSSSSNLVNSIAYTITAAPITVTITAAGSKTYDGTAPIPTVTYTRGTGTPTITPLPTVTWTAADFDYTNTVTGAVTTGTKDAGNYTVSFSAAGQAKLAALTNYTFTPVAGNYVISPKVITVIINNASKKIGAADPTFSALVKTPVAGETVKLNYSRESGEDIGSYSITATTADPNYKLANVTAGTLTIFAPGTIKFTAGSKTYDGKAINTTPKLTIGIAGGITTVLKPVQVALTEADYTITGADATLTNAGVYTIKLTTAGINKIKAANPQMAFTDLDTASGTYTINKKAATITVTAGQGKIYGTADPTTFAVTTSGTVGTEMLAYSVTRTAGEAIGSYPLTITLGNNPNYTVTTVDGSFVILAGLSATISSSSKVYDGKTIGEEYTPTVTLARTDGGSSLPMIEWVASDFTNLATVNSGTYVIGLSAQGQAKLSALTNYSVTTLNGKYTITKRAVYLDAGDYTKVFGDPDPTYTPIIKAATTDDGVVAGESLNVSVVRKAATTVGGVSYSNNDSEDVGDYFLDFSNGTNSNYNLIMTIGNLTIVPRSATATISTSSKTYDGANIDYLPTVKLSTSGSSVIPPITWTKSDFSYVKGTTTVLINKDASNYTIKFSATGAAKLKALMNFDFTTTQGVYTINKKDATITVTGGSFAYDGKVHAAPTPVVTGTVNNETLNYTLTPGRVDVGSETVTAIFDPTDDINKNYNITTNEATLTVTPSKATIQLIGGSKTYDGQPIDAAPTVTLTSNLVTDASLKITLASEDYTLTKVTGTADLTGAGTYDYHLTQAGIAKITAATSNYTVNDLSQLTARYTINRAKATITPSNQGKQFGTKDPAAYAVTITGVVSGDKLNYTVTRAPGENLGNYKLTITPGTNSNYDIVTAIGTFTISRRQVANIYITDGEKVYNGAPIDYKPKVTATLSDGSIINLVWPDDMTTGDNGDYSFIPSSGNSGTADLTGVGKYVINITPAGMAKLVGANPTYLLTDVLRTQGTYTIIPAKATVKINGSSKIYDGKSIDYQPTISLTNVTEGTLVPTNLTLGAGDYTIVKVAAGSGSDDLQDAGAYTIALTEQGVKTVTAAFSNFNLGTFAGTTSTYTIDKKVAEIVVTGGTFEFDPQNVIEHVPTAIVQGKVAGENLAYTVSDGLTYPGSKTVTATITPDSMVNKNYDINVVSGSLTITGDALMSVNRVIQFQGAGTSTPKAVTQTVAYNITENDAGQVIYSLVGALPSVKVPFIAGYTASIAGKALELNDDGTAYSEIGNNGLPVSTSVKPASLADITVQYTADEENVWVKATGNKAGTGFTYTVNGGDKAVGTYGETPLASDIHFGDVIVITPDTQSGYDATVRPTSLIVGTDSTTNTINVAYTANTQYVNVRYVVEKGNQEVELGRVQLSGQTDTDYKIPQPADSMNVNFYEGMGDEGLTGKVWNENVSMLKLDADKLPTLTGKYVANAGIPTVTIYYQVQDYTLNTEFFVPDGDSYKSVGMGTVSYDYNYDPKTDEVTEKISYVVPAGYETPPVESLIYFLVDDFYMSTGAADDGISVIGDFGFNVAQDGTATLNVSDVFEPYFVVTPSAQKVTVNAKGNQADNTTFTYTVNGGEAKTGTYGKVLPDIGTGDKIIVTPTAQVGYGFKQSSATIIASVDPTKNTDMVTYSMVGLKEVELTYGEQPTYTLEIQTDSGIKPVTVTAAEVDVSKAVYTNNGKYLAAGSYVVTLNDKGIAALNAANPEFTFGAITGKVIVDPKQVTLTVDADQSKIYGLSDPTLTASVPIGGLVGNDILNYTVNRKSGEDTGSYLASITLQRNDNYLVIPVANLFKIKPAATDPAAETAQVATNDKTITFGEATPIFSVKVAENSKLTLKGVALTNTDFDFYSADGKTKLAEIPTNAGTYKVNLNTNGQMKVQQANPNYTINSANFIAGTYTIQPLTTIPGDPDTRVDVEDTGITYGDAIPSFVLKVGDKLTQTGAGLTNADYFINDAKYTDSKKMYLAAGSYKVTLTTAGLAKLQAVNPNYKISAGSVTGGTLVVQPKEIRVTANSASKVYGTADPELSATVSAGVLNGDKLNYRLSREPGEDAGSYTTKVVVGTNANYVIVPAAGRFEITPAVTDPADADTNVAVRNTEMTYGDAIPTFTLKLGDKLIQKGASLINSDYRINGAKYTDNAKTHLAAGSYEITLTPDGLAKLQAVNPNYKISAGSVTGGILVVLPKQIIVSANNGNKIYGATEPKISVTVGAGVLTNDTLIYGVTREKGENVGTYFVKVTVGNNANYVIIPVAGRFEITPKPTDPNDEMTQVKVNAPSITYGETPQLSINVGSALTAVDLTAADYTIVEPSYTNDGKYLAAGSYAVTVNAKGLAKLQAANPNYKLDASIVIGTTLVVNKKVITVTANDAQKIYGAADPTLTATIVGLVGQDTLDYTVTRSAGEKVGHYTETVAGANANYTVITVDGAFTVTPKTTNVNDATTKVTVNNQEIKEGDATPDFTLHYGTELIQVPVSNADFIFMQNGHILSEVPTTAGRYTVLLSTAAQQRIAAAQNYALTISDFIAGTYVIQATSTNPGGNGENPDTGTNLDGNGENPGTDTNPGGNGENPGTGTNPGGNGENPGTGTNPGGNGENPGTGTNPDGNGENPGTDTNPGGNGENPNTGANLGNSGDQTIPENGSDTDNIVNSNGTSNQTDLTMRNNTGNGTLSTAKSTKQAMHLPASTAQTKLPQTGETSDHAITAAGLALLSGLFGLFGIRRKKHEDDA